MGTWNLADIWETVADELPAQARRGGRRDRPRPNGKVDYARLRDEPRERLGA